MRRSSFVMAFAFIMLLVMAIPGGAADVNEKSWMDVDCPEDEYAIYHFVLNRFEKGSELQTITVDFVNTHTVTKLPDKHNRGTQHFYVEGGPIASAETNGDGWLVLSDWECTGKKIDS